MKTNNLRPNGTNTPWQPNPRTVNPSTPLPPDLTPDPLNRKIQDGQKLVGGSADPSVLHPINNEGPNAYVPLDSYSSSDWKQGQSITIQNIGANIATIQKDICEVAGLPTSLCYRKIYVYLNVAPTGTAASAPNPIYLAKLVVELYRGNTKVGELPLATAGSTGPTEAVFSAFLFGGVPVADTIAIYTATGDAQNLHSHYVYSECDRLTVSIKQTTNIEGLYVAVGVISSKHKS